MKQLENNKKYNVKIMNGLYEVLILDNQCSDHHVELIVISCLNSGKVENKRYEVLASAIEDIKAVACEMV